MHLSTVCPRKRGGGGGREGAGGLMHKGWCLQLWSSMIFLSFCYTKNLRRAASGENI